MQGVTKLRFISILPTIRRRQLSNYISNVTLLNLEARTRVIIEPQAAILAPRYFTLSFSESIMHKNRNNMIGIRCFHSEAEFHQVADQTLEDIENAIEDLLVEEDEVETSLSSGVLTITLGKHGTWVINKQTPNQQIWWSSPLSGPKRFEFWINSKHNPKSGIGGVWAYTRRDGGSEGNTDGDEHQQQEPKDSDLLVYILAKEIRQLYGIELQLFT